MEMVKLDHLAIAVRDVHRARDWYVRHPDGYVIGLWDEKSMREKGGR
jgi:catechol 2,3-dioxygenase-like lactoylglutathione lyase family enzyme